MTNQISTQAPSLLLEKDIIQKHLTKLEEHKIRLGNKISEHPIHNTIRYILFFDFDGTLTNDGIGFKMKDLKGNFTKFIGGNNNEIYFRYFLNSINQNKDEFKMIILTWNKETPIKTFLNFAYNGYESDNFDAYSLISKDHSRYRYDIKNKINQIKHIYKNTDYLKHNDKLFFFEDRIDNLNCMNDLVYIHCTLVKPEFNFIDRLVTVCQNNNYQPQDLLNSDILKNIISSIHHNYNDYK